MTAEAAMRSRVHWAAGLVFVGSIAAGINCNSLPDAGYPLDTVAGGVGRALAIAIAIDDSSAIERSIYHWIWPDPADIRRSAFQIADATHQRYVRYVPDAEREKISENYRALALGEASLAGDPWVVSASRRYLALPGDIPRCVHRIYPALRPVEITKDCEQSDFRERWAIGILSRRLQSGAEQPESGAFSRGIDLALAVRIATGTRILQWVLACGGLVFLTVAIMRKRGRLKETVALQGRQSLIAFGVLAGALAWGEYVLPIFISRVFPVEDLSRVHVVSRGVLALSLAFLAWRAASRFMLDRSAGAREASRRFGIGLRETLYSAAWALAALGPIWLAVFVTSQHSILVRIPSQDSVLFAFGRWDGLANALLIIGTFSIARPIFEEILFRMLLYGSLRAWTGRFVAIIASALAFALFHSGGSQNLFAMFCVGVTLGAAREFSGSLLPAIVAHAINNMWARFGGVALLSLP